MGVAFYSDNAKGQHMHQVGNKERKRIKKDP
jgi:hypothetical protein